MSSAFGKISAQGRSSVVTVQIPTDYHLAKANLRSLFRSQQKASGKSVPVCAGHLHNFPIYEKNINTKKSLVFDRHRPSHHIRRNLSRTEQSDLDASFPP